MRNDSHLCLITTSLFLFFYVPSVTVMIRVQRHIEFELELH